MGLSRDGAGGSPLEVAGVMVDLKREGMGGDRERQR